MFHSSSSPIFMTRTVSSCGVKYSRQKTKNSTKQDTIYNPPALNISLLADVQLNELPKATGVVVVHGLRVAKSFHDGAEKKSGEQQC